MGVMVKVDERWRKSAALSLVSAEVELRTRSFVVKELKTKIEPSP